MQIMLHKTKGIVLNYIKEHPKVNFYEFNAVGREGEDDKKENARMLLYKRYLPKIFDTTWRFKIKGNFAEVTKVGWSFRGRNRKDANRISQSRRKVRKIITKQKEGKDFQFTQS